MFVIIFTISSCKKTESKLSTYPQISEYASPPQGTSSLVIQKQLAWIARALPIIANSNNMFKNNMHNNLTSTNALYKHTITLQTNLISTLNLTNTVHQTVFNNFPLPFNNYDSSYFFGFFLDDCFYKTLIQIPDLDIANNFNTKPLLSIPIFETNEIQNMGYFINNLNQLDSIIVDLDNVDDYYVWVVTADNMCLNNSTFGPKIPNEENTCGNGDCEPFLGETYTNCIDCQGNNGPQSGKYTLFLEEIQPLTDNYFKNLNHNPTGHDNRFHESYLSGKYDIVYQYAIVNTFDPNNNYIKDAWYLSNITPLVGNKDRYWYNNGYKTNKWTDIIFKRLNANGSNCEVQRCKSSTNGPKKYNMANSSPIQTTQKILSYNFDIDYDKIITDMYEFDKQHTPQIHNYAGNGYSIDMLFRYGSGNPNKKHYFAGYTNERLDPNYYPDWIDGSSIYGTGSYYIDIIDNDINTTPRNIIDLYVINKQSEMRIRYVIKPNP